MRLIDADKLITALEITITKSDADFESEYLNGIKQGIETALEIVKIAPTVEWKDIELMGYVNGEQITIIKPSKLSGHWVRHERFKDCFVCSCCRNGGQSLYKGFLYCPWCGARMEGEE